MLDPAFDILQFNYLSMPYLKLLSHELERLIEISAAISTCLLRYFGSPCMKLTKTDVFSMSSCIATSRLIHNGGYIQIVTTFQLTQNFVMWRTVPCN